MNQKERFDNILNECLNRILKGETIEQCLKDYPGQAKELESLLRTAMAAKVVSTLQPRPEFKARARYEFQATLRDMANKKSQRRPFLHWHWQWQSGWAIAIVVVLVVILGGGGTVFAASNSMPDNPLYPVKLATEQAQLAVTPSALGKAKLNARFAEIRSDEIVYMASKGSAKEVQLIAQRLNTNLQNITDLAGSEGGQEVDTSASTNGPQPAAVPSTTPKQEPMIGIAAAPATASPTTSGALAAPVQRPVTPSAAIVTSTPAPSIKAVVPAPESRPNLGSVPASSTNRSSTQHPDYSNQATQNNKKTQLTYHEELKQIIINNFAARQARLEEALKKASPQVRPAVRQAIAQSQSEYEKALKTLEQERGPR